MKPALKLREWQEDAKAKMVGKFVLAKRGTSKFALTHATPGGGKTVHGLSVFVELPCTHVVVVVPSKVLVRQWQVDAKKLFGLELSSKMIYSQQADFNDYNGIVMTYAAMHQNHEDLRLFCMHNDVFVLADEIHHISDQGEWGNSYLNAFENSCYILGLTGTPWTSNRGKIPFVKYKENGFVKTDFSYTKTTAIEDKVCRPTNFHKSPVNKIEVKNGKGESKTYETTKDAEKGGVNDVWGLINKCESYVLEMFKSADRELSRIRNTGKNAGGLIVAQDIHTAHLIRDTLIKATGEAYTVVHSGADTPHKKIEKFKTSTEKWLISVMMVTEGVDIKRLQVCLYLGKVTTELFIRQVVGRIERTIPGESSASSSFYYIDRKEINSIINVMEKENEMGLKAYEKEKLETAEREKNSTRNWAENESEVIKVELAMREMRSQGVEYAANIVHEAIKVKDNNPRLHNIDIAIICDTVISNRAMPKDNAPTAPAEQVLDAVPLDEKKNTIRKLINNKLSRIIFNAVGKNGIADGMKRAHINLNNAVGIKGHEYATIDQFNEKLKLILNGDVKRWLR